MLYPRDAWMLTEFVIHLQLLVIYGKRSLEMPYFEFGLCEEFIKLL